MMLAPQIISEKISMKEIVVRSSACVPLPVSPRVLEQEHAALERRLRQREDPVQMEALARRELGMVMPGETVFLFAEEKEAKSGK